MYRSPLIQQQRFLLQQQVGTINSPNRIDGVRPMPMQISAQSALFNQQGYAGLAGTQPPSLSSQQLPPRSTRTLPQQPQNIMPPSAAMTFYSQPPQSYFGEALHAIQVSHF